MIINYNVWNSMSDTEKKKIFNRSEMVISDALGTVQQIIENVKMNGDKALFEYNSKFDGVKIENYPLRVQDEEFLEAEKLLSEEVKKAINYSIANVLKFHKSQIPDAMNILEIRPGVYAGEKAIPIESAGLYVPRGRGSFPSMLYMQAIPAVVAGVKSLCIVTPPDEEGKVDPACLYAAAQCGIKEIYKTGGAQAIAALAYGTESIKPVLKITGPGSKYVSGAKRLVSHIVDPGLPAGPSDSAILADHSADPYITALDLMTESEHGSDSSAILVTTSENLIRDCKKRMKELIKKLPEQRQKFVKDVFSGFGGMILVDSIEQGAEVINLYAPEHLQIVTTDPWETIGLINNAGEILLGDKTPFSHANYSIGANAVLPTGGKARTWSALSTRDFIKYSSVVYSTTKGFKDLDDHVTTLAEYEGFAAHANALKLRYKNV